MSTTHVMDVPLDQCVLLGLLLLDLLLFASCGSKPLRLLCVNVQVQI